MLRKYTTLDIDDRQKSVWVRDDAIEAIWQNGSATSTIQTANGGAWRVLGMADDLASVIRDGVAS